MYRYTIPSRIAFSTKRRGRSLRNLENGSPLVAVYGYIWFMKSLNVSVKDVLAKTKEYLLLPKGELVMEGTFLTR